MSQHIHHTTQYVHYTGPPGAMQIQPLNQSMGIAPQDTTRQRTIQQQPIQQTPVALPQPQPQPQPQQQQQQPQPQPQQQQQQQTLAGSSVPLVAKGDWTKDLVQLAKTAELKKHALTLQLHTAHIFSAHASLEQKGKAIQDIREQKNKLECERTRLLNSLREINEDRDKSDLMESTLTKECDELRAKISQLTDGDYAVAKKDVDRLRQELGQQPLPSLQSTLDEKASQYLNERRLNGNAGGNDVQAQNPVPAKRSSDQDGGQGASKRPRGRPKGSKNKSKEGGGGSSGA